MLFAFILTAAADVAPLPRPAVAMERQLLWNETTEPEVSEAVLARSQNQLRYCYQRLAADPSLSGLVVLDWQIVEGRVQEAAAVTSTIDDAALTECLTGKLQRSLYPPSLQGRMIISLTFTPGQ